MPLSTDRAKAHSGERLNAILLSALDTLFTCDLFKNYKTHRFSFSRFAIATQFIHVAMLHALTHAGLNSVLSLKKEFHDKACFFFFFGIRNYLAKDSRDIRLFVKLSKCLVLQSYCSATSQICRTRSPRTHRSSPKFVRVAQKRKCYKAFPVTLLHLHIL